MASEACAQIPPADPKAVVGRLLQAIKSGDSSTYAEIGAQMVMMATPDFGVPTSFGEAQRTFGGCSLVSLSEPRALDGVPASIVSATMNCGAPFPAGPIPFDFMADGKLVHGVYPGGIGRFYPKLGNKPPLTEKR